MNLDNCNVNAACLNNEGSFDCSCNSGFEGTGFNDDCISKFSVEGHTHFSIYHFPTNYFIINLADICSS